MKRSQRMEKIVEINSGFENLAGASLASARSKHQAQANQLEQLKGYKVEYQEKLSKRMRTAISTQEIKDYEKFFDSLDLAITQQNQLVEQSLSLVEESKNLWLERKMEVSKIETIVEHFKEIETQAQIKKEQIESDELSQMLFTVAKKKNI